MSTSALDHDHGEIFLPVPAIVSDSIWVLVGNQNVGSILARFSIELEGATINRCVEIGLGKCVLVIKCDNIYILSHLHLDNASAFQNRRWEDIAGRDLDISENSFCDYSGDRETNIDVATELIPSRTDGGVVNRIEPTLRWVIIFVRIESTGVYERSYRSHSKFVRRKERRLSCIYSEINDESIHHGH